jgi:DNA-binding MurR/RpiR family transcriptional regulator
MLPAARVAERLGISESTVTRFAVLLGYEGYPAFRRDLQSEIRRHLAPLQRVMLGPSTTEPQEALFNSVFRQEIEDIVRTERGISRRDLEAAIDLLVGARNVYVAGYRGSYGLAHSLYFQLHQMLGNVRLHDAGHGEALDALGPIGVQDVLVCISFPRHAALAVSAVEFAALRHAKIIAITDGALSPIAPKAHVLFSVSTSVINAATSLIGGFALVNALCAEVPIRARERVAENLAAVEDRLRISKVHFRPG